MTKRTNYFLFILFFAEILFTYSCSVDIEGAPCDPALNNCPNGQYCSEEGICRYGSKDISIKPRDVSGADVLDASKDAITDIGDVEEVKDYVDAAVDIEDVESDIRDVEDVVDIKEEDVTDIMGDVRDVIEDVGMDVITDVCVPNCTNRECGDDGCGGSCGDCGSNASCNQNKCGCQTGYANCDGLWSNGCEVNLINNNNNCGACGNSCNSNAYCNNTSCSCNSGFGNCD
ncbi:MAG: hypothetical protein ACP5KG_06775, partial [Myxococcota bacterium]